MRGEPPLHLVKVLPLGSFHAPPADPSRKWGARGWGYKEPPVEPQHVLRLHAEPKSKGQSVLSPGESESAVCDQRDMGNRTACHTGADSCIFLSVCLLLPYMGCTVMTLLQKKKVWLCAVRSHL